MRPIAIALTIVTVATLAAFVKADDKPKRSPELQVLDRFVGVWDVKVTVKPAGQEAVTSDAVSFRSWSRGGSFVVFEDPGQEELNLSITYDPKSKTYPGVMIIGVGRGLVTGTWDEAKKTMNFVIENEDKSTYRGTHRFVRDDYAEAKGSITDADGKVVLKLSFKQTRRKDASASAAEGRRTIGFSTLTKSNPFFVTIADSMEAEAKKHGGDLICVSAEFNAAKQARQIDEFIAKKVAAIVLNPCASKTIGAAIKRANDAGIPVFTNDIKYAGDLGKVVCHVATDNYQGGKLAGKAMVDAIGESGGSVAILHFPPADSCQLRVKGFNEIVAKHNAKPDSKKIKVVATLDGGGSRGKGYKAAKDAIARHPGLVAFFAINDPSALGAYAALKDFGKVGHVTIIGFDGQPMGKRAILEGKILCDPVQRPDRIGRVTVVSIFKHLDGQNVEAEILIPTKLYYKTDAENDPALKKAKM